MDRSNSFFVEKLNLSSVKPQGLTDFFIPLYFLEKMVKPLYESITSSPLQKGV